MLPKPIKIWVSSAGPNPWKPVIICEELGLEVELELLSWKGLSSPEFKNVNPNGKVPVMYDPNTDIQIWESGAIVIYLIDQYDTEKKLTYTTLPEKAAQYQWIMFQMSQQGPYFGQLNWFRVLHAEKLPSAIDRYERQANRILGVLDDALKDKDWLVGEKCTYVDLSYFMWNCVVAMTYPPEENPVSNFKNVTAWHERMASREAVKKVLATREDMMKADGLGADGLPTDISLAELATKFNQ
ncbi:glutathione transferase [Periconia macrospinosa]|uniref:glutathione transferase n=1 Tax=Periconia macrospinosa TaxID=97972 RepID=A0A2V1EDW1_9PLEO|nr:glutathione transferase [Periconia macrospinosa]